MIAKLIFITIFIYFSSKSLGLFLNNKFHFKNGEYHGIGYLLNISIFFLLTLPVMIFKLNSNWLNIFGLLYLIICIYSIILSIKSKELFKFDKREILSLFLAFLFLMLYAFFLDFGYIDSYDSYFYSVLVNSASKVEHISTIDPYTGLSDIQNYYKYISYYYQNSFFANLMNIKYPYLVLIWCMTFINYFFVFITAFTICRFSKNQNINNILSIFFLTFILSIFRAPFNMLYIILLVISVYIFTFFFDYFKGNKNSKYLLLICIIGSIAGSSTILILMIGVIYVLFIINSIFKDKFSFKNILYISIPIIVLIFIYIFESFDKYYILLIPIVLICLMYYFIKLKFVNKLLIGLGKTLFVLIPFMLIFFSKYLNVETGLLKIFMTKDYIKESVNSSECLEEYYDETIENKCDISKKLYEAKFLNFDGNKHGTSMEYIYRNKDNMVSKIFIYITHSLLKYGGLIFLLIYGFFKLRKKPIYIGFVTYLITFFNPLNSNSLNILTFGLNNRIILFFNSYFSLIGIYYFIEWLYNFIKDKKYEFLFKKLLNYSWIFYLILSLFSLYFYVDNLKPINWNNYSIVYKVPKTFIEINDKLNQNINSNYKNRKPRIFYTSSAFNVSMIDTDVNNKIKIINSKEYMNYFENSKYINNKILLNLFFESAEKINFNDYIKPIKKKCDCSLKSLVNSLSVDYIVTKPKILDEEILNLFEVVYSNEEIQILKLKVR